MNRPSAGFSLIELVIVLAMIGILASIAIPSYRSHVDKTRRSDGKMALIQLAERMERFAYNNGYQYSTDLTGDLGYGNPPTSAEGYYTLSAVLPAGPCATPPRCPRYQLTAAPRDAQAGDGRLMLDSLGQRFHDRNDDGDYADAGEGNQPGDKPWE
jgi:type IV pilus assembly protein PilE